MKYILKFIHIIYIWHIFIFSSSKMKSSRTQDLPGSKEKGNPKGKLSELSMCKVQK